MSHKHIKNISVDRIFTRLQRLGVPTDNESDIIEWTGEALEGIGVVTQYQEAVCFAVVKDYTIKLPSNFHNIIQVARNNAYIPAVKESALRVNDIAVGTVDSGPSIPVALDERGMPIHDYELAYYRPFFDLQYEYLGWAHSEIKKKHFTPVHLAEHTFFDTVVCKLKGEEYPDIYKGSSKRDEYTIREGRYLKFSFNEGQVAIAYNRQAVDPQTGYPLVPDDESYLKAIENYCAWRHFTREFVTGKEGSQTRMQHFESEWIWYNGQSSSKSLMIEGVDEYQNFLEQRSYLVPPRNSYYGFFGKQYSNKYR